MDITRRLRLLGDLTPRSFMRRHWQKRPLLVRQAIAPAPAILSRTQLFELAGHADVDARLVVRHAGSWSVRKGPLPRRTLPTLKQPGWTLLVNGIDEHNVAARHLLDAFRFIPDARVDDVMLSYATDRGGVGPHVDSYDVFLLQLSGSRRWRIGPVATPALLPDLPLRILAQFEPTDEWLLEPGDMLYVPPGWGHDGVAEGECMTCSIGFRAPTRRRLGIELVERILDHADAEPDTGPADTLYADPTQPATAEPGRVPPRLARFAERAVESLLGDARARACALGEVLSEPRPGATFKAPPVMGHARAARTGIVLDRRTRMLYDNWHVFINGESFRAGGRDARLMHGLANTREMTLQQVAALSREAQQLLLQWLDDGWALPTSATSHGD